MACLTSGTLLALLCLPSACRSGRAAEAGCGRLSGVTEMAFHPTELRISDILILERHELIDEIMRFSRECFFSFNGEYLSGLSDIRLRRLLLAVRRHWWEKGY
jgi:hypothetical protein